MVLDHNRGWTFSNFVLDYLSKCVDTETRFAIPSMFPVLVLLSSVILFRIAPSVGGPEIVRTMAGWSPAMALALCGAAFFPRRWAVTAALAAVLVPHFAINLLQGFPVWDLNLVLMIAAVLTVAALGVAIGKKAPILVFVGAALMTTVGFHLVSNTVSFFTVPGYSPSIMGWVQAQTTGLPQFSPQTWVFSAKQVVGDLLFTLVFVFACRQPKSAAVPLPAAALD